MREFSQANPVSLACDPEASIQQYSKE